MRIIDLNERRPYKDPERARPQTVKEAPVGRFVRLTTNDGRGRARDGEEVYEVRSVPMGPSSDPGSEVVEVRFADGEWLLVDTSEVCADGDRDGERPDRIE